ncbi:MAG: glutaredoxin 3 [Alphaproteobacteria bacterium]|nr:glutaredoxin 3 [Alphaproteobacteria bacterium]
MSNVVVYSSLMCPYCYQAKSLLKQKNVDFQEIDVTFDKTKRAQMMEKANGRHTVPQIFIGDTHVGGCDELMALNDEGKLDSMLAQAS